MRKCTKCEGSGPFYRSQKSSDGLSSQCQACVRKWYEAHPSKVRAADRRAFIASLKTGKACVDCGSEYSALCMDFDHVRDCKRDSVSQMAYHSFNTILAEVAKCDLVCANCHRIRTETRRVKTLDPRKRAFNLKIEALKSAPCTDCGKTFAPQAMEFDHVLGEKVKSISLMHDSPWAKVQIELAKCQLVCACCHRTRTNLRRPSGSLPVSSAKNKQRQHKCDQDLRVSVFKTQGLTLLGTIPDTQLACQFGVDKSTVRQYRVALGIPAFDPLSDCVPFLGTMPDGALARQFGKNPEVVRRKRNALSIPVFNRLSFREELI
jgi:hypothetical protein